MLALFFEVQPRPGQDGAYFDIAAKLKPALDASGGLLFLDRSRSSLRPDWFLSHQFWRDEASMARWRANPAHHKAQSCGRTDVLADYRLRVAQVMWSHQRGEGQTTFELPPHTAYNHPDHAAARWIVSVLHDAPLASPPEGTETFASVYDPALLVSIVQPGTSGRHAVQRLSADPGVRTVRLCLVSRDYGMFDRAEAPQFFAPAASLP